MELTKDSLTIKVNALKEEIVAFARTAQTEINAIQTALQNKIRESQKTIDNLEGKMASYQELYKELVDQENPPDPKKDEKVIPFPKSAPPNTPAE